MVGLGLLILDKQHLDRENIGRFLSLNRLGRTIKMDATRQKVMAIGRSPESPTGWMEICLMCQNMFKTLTVKTTIKTN